jgi:phosphoglycolate phosphatase-like HAD superfamily hydrolase
MASAITTILWDVGGTLMDWATSADDSLARACCDCGLDPALLEAATVARARREFELDEPT